MALNDAVRNADRDGEVAEGALAFTITKDLDLVLLTEEILEATGWDEGSLAFEIGTVDSVAWVIPPPGEEVVTKRIKSIVSRHEVPPVEEKKHEGVEPDPYQTRLDDFRRLLELGEDLTLEQMQEVVKLLLKSSGRKA